jgi:hypothetical protein
MADVSSALQFSGNRPITCAAGSTGTTCDPNPIDTGPFVNCIGTTRYSYILNREQGTDPYALPSPTTTPHVLWRDTISKNAACVPLNLSLTTVAADPSSNDSVGGNSGGYDMIPDHMRLTRFVIEPTSSTGNVYNVDVWMAFGDSDLVKTNTGTGNSTCKGGAGTQFCSVSQLSSTTVGRAY